jgi:hypothetical protein
MNNNHYIRSESAILPPHHTLLWPHTQQSVISFTDWFTTPHGEGVTDGSIIAAQIYVPAGIFRSTFLALTVHSQTDDPFAFVSIDENDHFHPYNGEAICASQIFPSYFIDTESDSIRHRIYASILRAVTDHI